MDSARGPADASAARIAVARRENPGVERGTGRSGAAERERWPCTATAAAFARDLPKYGRALRAAVLRHDVAGFALACKLIRDYAGALGLRSLDRMAGEAVRAVRRTRSLDRSREEVILLALQCDRAAAA